MKADIDLTVTYPYPPSKVWDALTSQDALAAWLMPNDYTTVTFTLEPAAGAGTTLRMRQMGFHGLGGHLTRRILAGGWPGLLDRQLRSWLEQSARTAPAPAPTDTA
jgi:uncharacterized protein YndB with AHSA1/START domain